MRRFADALREIAHRLWLALSIIAFGRLEDGALDHLRIMMTELRYIEEHYNDMPKEEIVSMILGDVSKPQTGLIHHLAHAQMNDIWRVIAAARVEVKIVQLRAETIKKIKEAVERV